LAGVAGAALVAASAVCAVWQVSHGGLSAGNTAGVLGLPLGVGGLAVTVVAAPEPVSDLRR
jgi:hypothetical protein